jgi:hypothetical protein
LGMSVAMGPARKEEPGLSGVKSGPLNLLRCDRMRK